MSGYVYGGTRPVTGGSPYALMDRSALIHRLRVLESRSARREMLSRARSRRKRQMSTRAATQAAARRQRARTKQTAALAESQTVQEQAAAILAALPPDPHAADHAAVLAANVTMTESGRTSPHRRRTA